jgi:outer membrane protein OmpA-like peptidoglycan-associated protein
MTSRRTVAILLSTLLLVACHEPEPTSPVVGLTLPIDPPQPPDEGHYLDREITVHVFLTDNLRKTCAGTDPFFHYDSDRVTIHDQPGLHALAECMKTGALRDKRILLTGRADPRGTVDANDKLGLERAEKVKQFLVDHGVAADRTETATAGKTAAEPEPGKWRTDRRVDIDILP